MQARCYQLLLSVFQHSSRALSTPYIHALAPLMVEKLKAVESSRPGTAAELQAVQEGIRVLENLVSMGEEQNRKYFILIQSFFIYPIEFIQFLFRSLLTRQHYA